jgi:hypothetical protein
MAGRETFPIKYELCEVILCDVADALKGLGVTVMDGPFFSLMPFGLTGRHSLTSVTFTPHTTSYEDLPTFGCQARADGKCSPTHLDNCNGCDARPPSARDYMELLARKYLRDSLGFRCGESLFTIKPILCASEIDDSRPTMIRTLTRNPTLISVLSGKINTIYDLDEVLQA